MANDFTIEQKMAFMCETLGNSPSPIIISDNELNIIWQNKIATEKASSFDDETTFGEVFKSIKTPALLQKLAQGCGTKVNNSIADMGDFHFDITPVCENGKLSFCIISIIDIFISEVYRERDIRAIVKNLSSCFRRPLTIIFSTLGPLLRKFEEDEDYTGQEYVKSITRNCYSLLKDSSNVTDMIKYYNDDTKFSPQYGDLNEFLQNICDSAGLLIRPTAIPLHFKPCDEPVLTIFDPDKLTYALANVILNSCLYTKEDNSINITLKKKGNRAIIVVADRGMGMSGEETTNVFSPFYCAKSEHEYPSMGLGLPLVKEIAILHGGSVAINSIEGEGSVLALSLPIAERANVPAFSAFKINYLEDRFSPLYVVLAEVCSSIML